MKKKVAPLLAIAGLVMAGTTAHAISYSGARYGQNTWTSGANIWVKDSHSDNRFPSAQYLYDGGTKESGLANKSGYGTTVHRKAPSTITAIQPCISRFLRGMDCGSWVY